MADYNDEILDHDYDGIREMDNNLPKWWLWLFYLTIIWSVLYMLYYHVLDVGYSSTEAYLEEVDPSYVRIGASDAKFLGMLPEYHSPYYDRTGEVTPRMIAMKEYAKSGPRVMMTAATDTTIYVATEEPSRIANGLEIYIKNCASCHGKLGEGGIGPNMTDDYWLHGGKVTEVVKSVIYGYPAKGMIPWRGTLKQDEIIDVTSYMLTLRGTNPPNGKASQGELVTEFE